MASILCTVWSLGSISTLCFLRNFLLSLLSSRGCWELAMLLYAATVLWCIYNAERYRERWAIGNCWKLCLLFCLARTSTEEYQVENAEGQVFYYQEMLKGSAVKCRECQESLATMVLSLEQILRGSRMTRVGMTKGSRKWWGVADNDKG